MNRDGPIFVPEHVATLSAKMAEFFPNHSLLSKPQFLKINQPSLIKSMVEGPCGDRIGLSYAEASFKKLKLKSYADGMDILVMHDVTDIKAPIKIDAFILIEKGECKKLPSTYSVNLICSLAQLKGNNGIGGGLFLLASFLYCLKHYFITEKISDQKAILELANSYENIQGFITYTKLGFHKDVSLTGDDCLEGLKDKNLPMTMNLSRVQPNDFLDFLDKKIPYVKTAGLTQLYRHIDDDTGLFNLFRTYTPGKLGESVMKRYRQEEKQKECAGYATILSTKQFSGGRTDIERRDLEYCKNEYEDLFENARSYPVRYVQSFYKISPRRKIVKSVRKSKKRSKKSVRKSKKSVRKSKKSVRKSKKSVRKSKKSVRKSKK